MKFSIGNIAALAAVVLAAASTAFAGTQPNSVPEPASLALVATGVGAVMLVRKLRSR